MTSITIENIDEALEARLRERASDHGRSIEDEVRDMIRAALDQDTAQAEGLATSIRRKVALIGGIDLPFIEREPMREPPPFSE